jgi:5'-nucleotidase
MIGLTVQLTTRGVVRIAAVMLLAGAALPGQAAWGLNILLSNDDGWSAVGIETLHSALIRAGHTVTLVAPGGEQSGSSAAFDLRNVRVRREATDQYSVHVCTDKTCQSMVPAKPATSVLVGIDIASRRNGGDAPDLVMSGTNLGANTGGLTQFSGTVGAVIAALSGPLGGSIPAIALSSDPPSPCGTEQACIRNHMRQVAAFGANLVAYLARQASASDMPLLPPGVGLNVNYPSGAPLGVNLARQGQAFVIMGRRVSMQLRCAECAALDVGAISRATFSMKGDAVGEAPVGSDSALYRQGYITIVPVKADLTVSDLDSFSATLQGFRLESEDPG